ncbi:MAG: LytR C-terminal domain-containing protein [Candidatus Moranbacteria bacterium]|nr:LytR C-terminal domain-containing protein [Candidatus Moranbacteria bacterium]
MDDFEIKDEKKDSGEIKKGTTSIAETLWEEYEKREAGAEMDSLKKEGKVKDIVDKKTEDKKAESFSPTQIKEIFEDEEYSDKKEKSDEEMMSEYLSEKKSKRSWIFLIFYILILVAVAAGSFVAGRMGIGDQFFPAKKQEAAAPAPVEQEFPDVIIEENSENNVADPDSENESENPRETVEPDFSDASILVLNGGSTTGAAGKMKEDIAAGNEDIKSIEAKNAVGSYTEGTVIYYQEEFIAEAEKIKEILNEVYGELELKKIDELPEGESQENIVIIIGEK